MGLIINQNDERSKLQQRLNSELRERSRRNSLDQGVFDGENDTNYLKDTKTTTSLAWVWVVILLVTIGILIWLFIAYLPK